MNDGITVMTDPVVAENMNAIMNMLHQAYGKNASILCGITGYQWKTRTGIYIYATHNVDERHDDNGKVVTLLRLV